MKYTKKSTVSSGDHFIRPEKLPVVTSFNIKTFGGPLENATNFEKEKVEENDLQV